MNTTIQSSPFTIISAGINKQLLTEDHSNIGNLYELSLESCLESLYTFLQEKSQPGRITHIIIESRGANVDRDLETAFNKITEKNQNWQNQYPLKILFMDKRTNNIGLQIADLIAYPLGRFIVNPYQRNLSFEILQEKLYQYPNYMEEGLKIFPFGNKHIAHEKRKASEQSEALTAD